MRIFKLSVLFSLIFTLSALAQDGKKYYLDAFNEQLAMIRGQKPVDFKRAVFLTENSFYKGKLSYQTYCNDIADISQKLRAMIAQRGLAKFRPPVTGLPSHI